MALTRLKSKNLLIAACLLMLLVALSANAVADTLARTFGANQTIPQGSVVALSRSNSQNVELAPAGDVSRIYGVAINPSDSAVTLDTGTPKVTVITSGSFQVLVSLSSGTIQNGDYLSMSKTDGVAAKASVNQAYILGKALANFDGGSGVVSGSGQTAIGLIKVDVSPGKNPLSKSDPSVPGPLLKIANALAGRPVTAVRVYTALGVFLVTLAVAGSLIWVGVRTSMISIGRNPLSKHSIIQGLVQVIVAAAVVFGGGLVGVYLLLRL